MQTIWDRFYMLRQTPNEAYDGLVFIKTATPATPLSGEEYVLVKSLPPVLPAIIVLLIITSMFFEVRKRMKKR